MNTLLMFCLLLLTIGISGWDGYIAGRVWHDSKLVGGFVRLVAWSALIMSACGFFSVFALILALVALAAHWINHTAFTALNDLVYLAIIFPVLGAGLIITIQSWIVAYRERTLGSGLITGYNTAAMASNVYDAVENVGGAFSGVISFFSKDDDDDESSQAIVLLIVGIAMILGFGVTYFCFRAGLRNAPEPVQPTSYSR